MSRRVGHRAGLAAAAAAVLVAALVSGCSGFPNQGPVVQGPRVDAADSGVAAFAQPPTPGASPEDIVSGFLRAGEDVHEDHKVAREFLASPQTVWNPGQSVVVLATTPKVTLVSEPAGSGAPLRPLPRDGVPPHPGDIAQVRVSAPAQARVTGNGIMAVPSAGGGDDGSPTFSAVYTLVADRRGEWRISRAAPGLVLTRDQFATTFRAVKLYFADATGHWLVPDLRWFPDPDQTDLTPIATLAVKALLQGPAPWLGGSGGPMAVTSGVHAGTRLSPVAGVQISDGTVRVDLERSILKAQNEQRRVLRAQLLATLQGLVGAAQVVLTTDQGSAVYVPDGLVPRIWPDTSAAAAPLERDDPARLRDDQTSSWPAGAALCMTPQGRIGGLDRAQGQATCRERKDLVAFYRNRHTLSLPTSDGNNSLVAALVDGRSIIAAVPAQAEASSAKPVEVLRGANLSAPDIDVDGWVWTTDGGRVLAGQIGAQQRTVSAPWLAGAQVRAVRLSPEGARALLLVTRGGTTQAVVAGVARDNGGAPTAFTDERLAVVGMLDRAVDAGWSDDTQVTVLGSRPGDDALYVLNGTVGGEGMQKLVYKGVPESASGLAISGTVDVYVRTADGKALALSVGEWKPLDVRDLTLPD